MNVNHPQPDAQHLDGELGRINRLGSATDQLFSRLYRGLGRRSQLQTERTRIYRLRQQYALLQQMLDKRNSEIERLNSILASISEGVIMQDLEGRIVLINAAARQMLGTHRAVWDTELGRLFEGYRDVEMSDSELVPLGEPTKVEVNNRVVGAQIAAMADSGGQRLGTLIVLRDVTRETLLERIKDEFVTAISHELRTPLTVIKHVSDLLANRPEDAPPERRFLAMLTRNVDILDRMIVELLDVSEMSAGAFGILKEELDLEEIVWNVVNGMTPEIKRAQLEVSVMARRRRHLQVIGDGQRLRWALGHLLQNSIRYTESGGRIIITVQPTDDNHVAIQVVDTGVGISEKDLPHVFERFYRGKPRTREGRLIDPRGLGQGLFIAQSVVEAHGGYLSVRSDEGQGSIFTMVLPVRAMAA